MLQIFGMGSNASGQLGLRHQDDVDVPTSSSFPLIDDQIKVSKIVGGGNHTLIVLSNGDIYAAGKNEDGRCLAFSSKELSQSAAIFHKRHIDLDGTSYPHFKLCAATFEGTISVLEDDRIISAGTGFKGELGLGHGITEAKTPQAIPDFLLSQSQILDLSASMAHVAVVLSNGEVYGWGSGRRGQLGVPSSDSWTPRRIKGVDFEATRVVCGKDFTIIASKPEIGKFIVIGSNRWNVISNAPEDIHLWKDIGASWGSIFVLFHNGYMLSWGRNDHKQLRPVNLPKIREMAIGSEHVICITHAGEIISWGWGEHGNCGHITSAGENDFGLSSITVEGSPVFVGAGCATSFIACVDGSG
jgi:protein ATS1